MPLPPPRAKTPGRATNAVWAESIGQSPHTVWVGKRPEKNGIVYLRWQEERAPRYRSLGFGIRNARGEILARKQKEARDAAIAAQGDWKLGIAPNATKTARTWDGEQKAPTLQEGFTLALRSSLGMFVSNTKHKHDWIQRSEDVMAALTDPARKISGAEMTWDDIVPGHAQIIWRFILHVTQDGRAAYEQDQTLPAERRMGVPKPRGDGARKAAKAVTVLYQVARWLHDRDPSRYPLKVPLKRWSGLLKEEWRQATGIRPGDAEQPAYTPDELQHLLSNLREAEPRTALMIELGAEQRVGQAIRVTRRDINLGSTGGFKLGQIDLRRHGHGKKTATILDIHPELHGRLLKEMATGYLREMETAFQRGELTDYHVFPAGKLTRGVVQLGRYVASPKHMLASSLNEPLRRYEEALKIKHVTGRAWYGLRRVLSDEAEDVTTDSRVLREITGWTHEETRRRYQKKRRAKTLAGAAQVRHEIRRKYRGSGENDETKQNSAHPGSFPNGTPESQSGMIDIATLPPDIRELVRRALQEPARNDRTHTGGD